MAFKTLELVLGADVADSGTVTGIAYPTGTNQAFFTGDNASASGVVFINHNDEYTQGDSDIGITYGGSTITLTNNSGVTWPAGATVTLQLGYATPDPVNVIAQPAIADLVAISGGEAPTESEHNAVRTKINDILEALRAAGILDAS